MDKLKPLITFLESSEIIKRNMLIKLVRNKKITRLLKRMNYIGDISSQLVTINRMIDIKKVDLKEIETEKFDFLMRMYLSHRFDVLGSGWVSASYDSVPLGLEGIKYSNQKKTSQIINELDITVTPDYKRIDWSRDLKTGFSFDNRVHSDRIRSKIPRGVDIKVPWELSRMYHLPQIALYAVKRVGVRSELIKEYKNQLIDFFETNQIGFGVNYSNPMEVAIRSANILLSYDIIKQVDDNNDLDPLFEAVFIEQMVLHGRFIINNLEYNYRGGENGNHYLANLCGLIFISSFIETEESQKWMSFAEEELRKEISNQFLEDGSFFEGSTAYHRLCTEMVFYSIAILIENNRDIAEEIIVKVNKMIDFSLLIRKGNGEFVQIGDNDSGRLFKLNPRGQLIDVYKIADINKNLQEYTNLYQDENVIFNENELLIDSVLASAYALTRYKSLSSIAENYKLEYSLLNSIQGTTKRILYKDSHENSIDVIEKEIDLRELSFQDSTIIKFKNDRMRSVSVRHAPEFGVHVFESEGVQLFIRSYVDYKKLRTGHAHNDLLHYEIYCNGRSYFSDSGSYIYTPIIEKRNSFRQSSAHNVPKYSEEITDFVGPFKVRPLYSGEIIVLNNNEIGILLEFRNIKHYRHFYIHEDYIVINDYGSEKFTLDYEKNAYLSKGYGILQERTDNVSTKDIEIINSNVCVYS